MPAARQERRRALYTAACASVARQDRRSWASQRVLRVAPPAVLGRGVLMLVRALVSPAAHDGRAIDHAWKPERLEWLLFAAGVS